MTRQKYKSLGIYTVEYYKHEVEPHTKLIAYLKEQRKHKVSRQKAIKNLINRSLENE